MASISNDPNGTRRILFTGKDRKRRQIRLGKVNHRYAESVKVKIEDLVAANITGAAPLDETSRWLTNLDDAMHRKLAAVGLVKARESAMLGTFTRTYIDNRADIKPRTRINLDRARRYLMDYLKTDKALHDFTPGDADDFRLHLIRDGKATNTVNRALGRASQFFEAAKRRGLVQTNPFEGIAVSMRANTERFYFISQTDAQKVIDACPDAQWKLIFALARFGGLRCPSEVLALKWTDVNWEHNRIRVPSPKTEHHEGGESRMIPLFPELRPHLLGVFEEAEPGAVHVITRYRASNTNLRTHLQRIIDKAGLKAWPKLFQNLRSTRETELAEQFPIHVVCKWIGNSQPVAAKHYLQLTDEHFRLAVGADQQSESGAEKGAATAANHADHKAAQKAAQNARQTVRIGRQTASGPNAKTPEDSGVLASFQPVAEYFDSQSMPRVGLEPTTR